MTPRPLTVEECHRIADAVADDYTVVGAAVGLRDTPSDQLMSGDDDLVYNRAKIRVDVHASEAARAIPDPVAVATAAYIAAWRALCEARKAAGLDDGPAPMPDATGYPV